RMVCDFACRAQVHFHPCFVGDGVRRCPADYATYIKRGLPILLDLELGNFANGPAQCMDWICHSEGAVTVAARSLVLNAIAIASNGNVRNGRAGPVHRDESVDGVAETAPEKILYAAQIADSFLAYRSTDRNGPGSPEFCLVQGPDEADHDGQPAAFLGDGG